MSLRQVIDAAWEERDSLGITTRGEIRDSVEEAIRRLDEGEARVAEKGADGWTVNQWLKKAVLLSFRLNDNALIPGPGGTAWFDKVPSKFEGWDEQRFRARLRAVPGAIAAAAPMSAGTRADASFVISALLPAKGRWSYLGDDRS